VSARLSLPLGPASATCDVVALGENSLDFVAELGPGLETASKRSLTGFTLRVGGQMATAAVGVARLGFRAAYVGPFADDAWGDAIRRDLAAAAVTVHPVVRHGSSSRIAVVLVSANGDRQILEHRDPSLVLQASDLGAEVTSGRLLMVDATNLAASVEAARRARSAGIPTIVDADRVTPDVDELLGAVDVIVLPEPFVIEWAGVYDLASGLEMMALRFPTASAIVATRGPGGSLALAGGEWTETAGFDVPVVDTTGAGDAFRAGLAARWLALGSGADLSKVLAFANAVAALNCRSVGAQSGLPTFAEAEALCNGRPR
jgi:sulfofructose kinase